MILTTVIFILSLLVLVLVHELGHFLMARKFNIKVLEFGFGIPPRIIGKKIGETIYSLNWLPVGGFVRLLGEDEGLDKKTEDYRRSFAAQKVWKRILVVIAGVVMNLALAWILFYTVLIAQNFRIIYPTPEPVVMVLETQKDFPAEAAGIKPGDRIMSINGQAATSIDEAIEQIKGSPGEEIILSVADIKGENQKEVTLTPTEVNKGEGLIGVAFSPAPFKQYSTPLEKVFSGVTYSWDLTKLTFAGLGMLFGDLIEKDYEQASQSVSGPIGLAVATNNILGLGIDAILPYLWFMGVISLTLAIFNFLPIPALDGGKLLFLYIEAVFGKKVHEKVEGIIHNIGFIILLGLIFLIAWSDINKFF